MKIMPLSITVVYNALCSIKMELLVDSSPPKICFTQSPEKCSIVKKIEFIPLKSGWGSCHAYENWPLSHGLYKNYWMLISRLQLTRL
jgi:hypothetical protein